MLQTEFPFTLPRGFVDDTGTLHREGVMRLATAGDELQPMRDPRVRQNPAFASIIILSRVVVRLGSLDMITPQVIEGLFAADFAALNEMYDRINAAEPVTVQGNCPACGAEISLEGAGLGES